MNLKSRPKKGQNQGYGSGRILGSHPREKTGSYPTEKKGIQVQTSKKTGSGTDPQKQTGSGSYLILTL